jgi:hypothetical protein
MDIAQNDAILSNIKESMQDNKNDIIKKLVEIKRAKDENKFVNVIYSDYQNYYDYIINEKIKTKNALLNILKHLGSLKRDNIITNDMLVQTKKEQNDVLSKLYNVKSELELLTQH